MINPFPVAWADLQRARVGVAAVILLIALGVALGVAVSTQERALREGTARAADAFDLIIGAPGSQTQLVLTSVYLQPGTVSLVDGSVLQRLADDPRVVFAAPIGFGDSFRDYPVVGTTAEFVEQSGDGVSEGRVFEKIFEVVVGADVELSIGGAFRPVHGEAGVADEEDIHEEVEFVVVGRLARQGNPWDRAILTPIEAVWWAHGLPTGRNISGLAAGGDPEHALMELPVGPPWEHDFLPGVPAIVVKPDSVSAAYGLRNDYRAGGTMAVFPAEVLVQLYELLGNVRDLLAAISVVTQVLVIAAVLLAVLAVVSLRKRLIGILRALGASRSYIFAVVWVNVSAMIAGGALLGLALGWIGARLLSAFFAAQSGIVLPVVVSGQELRLVGLLVVIGLALSAVPAALVCREPVVKALRS
jgi:putative ABC transport system permease protein